MIKRFLYTSIFGILVLLASATQALAQKDSIIILRPKIDLGSVQLGTVKSDTANVRLAGSPRTIQAFASDTGLQITSPTFPIFSQTGNETFTLQFQVSARKIGPDVRYIYVTDSVERDSIEVTLNGVLPATINTSPDTLKLGPVLVGGSITDSFRVFALNGPVSIVGVSIFDATKDSVAFSDFPVSILAGDSATISFTIFPKSVGKEFYRFRIFGDGGGSAVSDLLPVFIEGVSPSSPDSVFILDPNRREAFAAISNADSTVFDIPFRYTGPDSVIIDSVNFDSSPNFKLSFLPDTLHTGDPFVIRLELIAPQEGFYKTNIRVPNDGGLASEYTLSAQVLRIAKNSVPIIHTPSGIRVTQSATSLAIEHLPFETGKLEIFDLLGRSLAAHSISSNEILIPKTDSNGAQLEDSCYLIRLTDTKGRFSEVLKVLLVSY
jgi:hypothetical protein